MWGQGLPGRGNCWFTGSKDGVSLDFERQEAGVARMSSLRKTQQWEVNGSHARSCWPTRVWILLQWRHLVQLFCSLSKWRHASIFIKQTLHSTCMFCSPLAWSSLSSSAKGTPLYSFVSQLGTSTSCQGLLCVIKQVLNASPLPSPGPPTLPPFQPIALL